MGMCTVSQGVGSGGGAVGVRQRGDAVTGNTADKWGGSAGKETLACVASRCPPPQAQCYSEMDGVYN